MPAAGRCRGCFTPGGVGLVWGASVQAAVRSDRVVVDRERVELLL